VRCDPGGSVGNGRCGIAASRCGFGRDVRSAGRAARSVTDEHILLPTLAFLRRADLANVIGEALSASIEKRMSRREAAA
jgi:hypothetical protein